VTDELGRSDPRPPAAWYKQPAAAEREDLVKRVRHANEAVKLVY